MDGDGYLDVIVGAPGYDGDNGDGIGRVYVYSGAGGAVIHVWEGEATWNIFGHALDAIGDVDGDGRSDVIVGAPFYPTIFMQIGRVYVFSGATSELLWVRDGDGLEDNFGWSVAGAGDIDGDGTPDVIVGARAPGPNIHQPGRAYVLSGGDGRVIWEWEGDMDNDRFGGSVDGLGDADGDGVDDLIVGALGSDTPAGNNSGRVYVFSGAKGDILWTEDGEQGGSTLGYSVSNAGDLNGDGLADVIVGSPDFVSGPSGVWAGKTYAYIGACGSLLWSRIGAHGGDRFGVAVAGVGDLDGDGGDDVIIGSQFGDSDVAIDVGTADAYAGADGAYLQSWCGEEFFDLFGGTVAAAGDMNSDGYADVLIGAVHFDNPDGLQTGQAAAFPGGPASDLTCDGMVDLDDLSALLAGWGEPSRCHGDLDGDGVIGTPDLLQLLADWDP